MGRLPNAILEYLWIKRLNALGVQPSAQELSKIRVLVRNGEPPEGAADANEADQCAAWMAAGIEPISILSERYPQILRELATPPKLLFCRGSLALLQHELRIAIVGSRNCDQRGAELAQQFAADLTAAGVLVVSGLALGIDGAAHRGALQGNRLALTIAVLGNGVDSIYPKKHHQLGEEILARGGLIISQFEPGTPPYPANFLERNHIIAGLCSHTLVIQAAERSGALVTARLAGDFGREVLAVPGAIWDPRHAGTNRLIRSGAALIGKKEDLFEELGLVVSKPIPVTNVAEERLLALLRQDGEMGLEQLRNRAEIDDFHATLLSLETSGLLLILPGNKVAASNL